MQKILQPDYRMNSRKKHLKLDYSRLWRDNLRKRVTLLKLTKWLTRIVLRHDRH